MTTKTTAGRGAVWSIALLLVAIENSAAVPRVLCKLVPLYRQTQPCFPGIFCLGVVRHLATFTSVALKPVSIGLRHARLLPSTMKERRACSLGTHLETEAAECALASEGAGDYCEEQPKAGQDA